MNMDSRQDIVYWGEVGPDSHKDSTIGPRGYDEVNQVKRAGNYGWPCLVADNKTYAYMNLVQNTPEVKADPMRPRNPSKNNTGLEYLPAGTEAFMYYPYDFTEKFPEMGKGGRSACAGPVYYAPQSTFASHKIPDYYHDKLFIFEWMRDKIWAVTRDKDQNFMYAEPFMEHVSFNHPTDIAFGPDGSLWVIDYGFIWYSNDDNTALYRIRYEYGNRAPELAIELSDSVVAPGQEVVLDVSASTDPDGDNLNIFLQQSQAWEQVKAGRATLKFDKAGIYKVKVKATDAYGKSSIEDTKIIVGNTYPKVQLRLKSSNETFYWAGAEIGYQMEVEDADEPTIDWRSAACSLSFLKPSLKDKKVTAAHSASSGPITMDSHPLIAASDCKACHDIRKKSVGPPFVAIAQKYATISEWQYNQLAEKIIKGGAGVWGDHAMSAHPQVYTSDAISMVKWIIGLQALEESSTTSMALPGGTLVVPQNETRNLVFEASYTDKGTNGIGRLRKSQTKTLRNALVNAELKDSSRATSTISKTLQDGSVEMYEGAMSHGEWIKLAEIDLAGIRKISIRNNSLHANGYIEVRSLHAQGRVLASVPVTAAGAWEKWEVNSASIAGVPTGKQSLYFVFVNAQGDVKGQDGMINLDWIYFER